MNTASELAPTPGEARCICCGARSNEVLREENGFEARVCGCGSIYVTPTPKNVDETRDLHPYVFYALPAGQKLKWLARSRPGGRLLEVGCGKGAFLREAIRRGYQVAGVEPSVDRARRVAEDLGIEVECRRIEDTELAPGQFDVVCHTDLLSHFPDPRVALNRMSELLKPDGALFFEVGSVAKLSQFWYDRTPTLGMPYHRWFFSEASLELLLGSCELRIERMQRFGLGPSRLVSTAIGRLRSRPAATTVDLQQTGPASSGSRYSAQLANFLRYRMGAITPQVGEGTLFVLATRTGDAPR